MQTRRLQQAIIAHVCFLLKRFEFYTSVFKRFTRLKYIRYMPHLNKTSNFAFDHTDTGDQPGHALTNSTFVMSTWTTLIRLGGCSG